MKMYRADKKTVTNENGFTLVELVVVLVIIVIIATTATAKYFHNLAQVKATACKSHQLAIEHAQVLYWTDRALNGEGEYADELNQLIPFFLEETTPVCPSEGSYLLDENGSCTCSIDSHHR